MRACKIFITTILIFVSAYIIAQTPAAYITRELNDYASYEQRGGVRAEGDSIDGQPHGKWTYYLISNDYFKYYEGEYDQGKREGVWKNFSVDPPEGYVKNDELVRSTEIWQDGRMIKWKGGQNNVELVSVTGLSVEQAEEIRRLDEAIEMLFRKTYGQTVTYIRGESLESLQTFMLERFQSLMLGSGTEGYIKYWNLNKQLEFHEIFNEGVIAEATYYDYQDGKCISQSQYANDILQEKCLFIMGELTDVDIYLYYPEGGLRQMKSYRGDSIRAGRWMSYYENGKKKCIGTYVDGKKHGKWTLWDQDGNKTMLKYDNGKME